MAIGNRRGRLLRLKKMRRSALNAKAARGRADRRVGQALPL